MKKLTLLIVFSVIYGTGFVNAQTETEQKFHFGLKASPNFNWLRVDEDNWKSDGSRIGISYGLMTEFAISKNYAFATGLDITYRSGKYTISSASNSDTAISITQKFQYIEIPLGLKLKTNEIGYMKYYGLFGVLPGIMVKAKEDVEVNKGNSAAGYSNSTDNGNQSNYYPFNVHLNIGAGIEYNLGGSTSLTAGIHYNNGLIDIFKGPKSENLKAQIRTDAIVLNIGMFF